MREVHRALRLAAATDPDAIRVVDADGHRWTNSRIASAMSAVGAAVRAVAPSGSRVLVRVESAGFFWAASAGVACAGMDVVPLAADMPTGVLDRVRRELSPSLTIDDSFQDELIRASGSIETVPPAGFGGVVLLSSGTTGRSRFVRRSSCTVDLIARGLVASGLYAAGDRCTAILPLHHAYGFEHAFLGPALAGGTVFHGTAFDPLEVAMLLQGSTVLATVPAALRSIFEIGWPKSAVRRVITAGTRLSPSLRARLRLVAPGVELVDLYGATELGTIWLDRGNGGVPVPGVSVKLGDQPGASEGEILVRSEMRLDCFLGSEEPVVDGDGWFHTGDIGRRKGDGAFAIVGRSKLIFDVGGLKVNPQDVESALEEHPGVRACLVSPVRLSDDLVRVAATIEPVDTDGPTGVPTVAELREFLRDRIASHSIPRSFDFTNRLPRTPSGKVLRSLAQVPGPCPPTVRRPDGLGDQAARMSWTQQLFDEAAAGYDWSSAAGTLWSDGWYRRRELLRVGLREGGSLLDVGGGTGRGAAAALRIVGPRGRVALVDPSPGMAAQARKRGLAEVTIGQAEALPFPDRSFDVVLMGYMLRHVEDMHQAFSEARRVLKPLGRICVLEVSKPTGPVGGAVFRLAAGRMLPLVSRIGSGRAAAGPMMAYWARTMEDAVTPAAITDALRGAGFTGARHHRELGIFSSYRGLNPQS